MELESNDSVIESTTVIARTLTCTAKISKGGQKKVRDFIGKQAISITRIKVQGLCCRNKFRRYAI